MLSNAAERHSTSPNRFFALTPTRLDAVTKFNLSRAEMLVWAAVEMGAKPRRPMPFSLERLAENLHLVVETVRRAVRRLLSVGLLVGFFKGNRHHLAPAAGAWEDCPSTPTAMSGCAASNVEVDPEVSPTGMSPLEGSTLTSMSGCLPENTDRERAGAPSPDVRFSEGESKLDLCLVGRELVDDWNVYPKVAVDLVERFGQERVSQVMAWGRWLKSKGKIRSLGWVYQALVRGWVVPDGFQRATKAPTSHRQITDTNCHHSAATLPQPVTAETPREATPEERLETIKQMLASRVPGVRRMGERLAADWGVTLEAERVV